VWKQLRAFIWPFAGAFTFALAADCTETTPQLDGAAARLIARPPASDDCRIDMIRPSALPPAEGLWSADGANGVGRVAVMISPAEVRAGSTTIVRGIEALETALQPGVELRIRSDTAVVRLDLLPPYGSSHRSSIDRDTSHARQSAAVYAITPQVLVAAYEPCVASGAPAIRYLRRDSHGRVIVDAMLRRETGSRDQ
jgi:hypothetical protein